MLAFIFSSFLLFDTPDNFQNEIIKTEIIKKEHISIGKRLMKKRRKL
jgi:hypothetical protein